ncbi:MULTISPECIES: hypothetical protein [unclassified Variovorax]|uniref:hypothetical protein n=1 Tax=unclassified Variovorax TaxID=663243 RepID=UPI00076CE339|nr:MULTISPECIES: hypothetical protein [unclassified Variovorax]KWT98360.1 hypothetical protein APY03_0495 [Variovorax sp. WDL1]
MAQPNPNARQACGRCYPSSGSATLLSASESSGHRLLDAEGVSHYALGGWVHISWKAKEGHLNFVS